MGSNTTLYTLNSIKWVRFAYIQLTHLLVYKIICLCELQHAGKTPITADICIFIRHFSNICKPKVTTKRAVSNIKFGICVQQMKTLYNIAIRCLLFNIVKNSWKGRSLKLWIFSWISNNFSSKTATVHITNYWRKFYLSWGWKVRLLPWLVCVSSWCPLSTVVPGVY